MTTRARSRPTLRAAGVAVLFCAALAGCSTSAPAPAKSAPASPAAASTESAPARSAIVITDPAKALAGSISGITAGRYRFDVAFPGGHLIGSVDRADHQAQWTDTLDNQPGRVIEQTRVIGSDMYEARSNAPNADEWEHFDLSRMTADNDPLTKPDVIEIGDLLKTMTATSATGATIHGTLKLSAFDDPSPDLAMLIGWASAGPIPASAVLDDDGRLVELTAALPATGKLAPAGPLTVQLSAYAAAVAAAPRPSSTSEAPALVYQAN